MNKRDCKHGRLARSCNECDLEAQLAEANASIKQFDELTDRQSIHISDLAHEVDKANAKIAELQAKLKGAEPVAWMFQHEETGRTMCVDVVQVENGFEQNNPRLQKIAPLFTAPPQVEAAVEDFRRRAVEVIETSMFEYTCKSGVTRKDMTEAIESLPAFETKGETK